MTTALRSINIIPGLNHRNNILCLFLPSLFPACTVLKFMIKCMNTVSMNLPFVCPVTLESFSRRLLRFMCAPDQIRGLLWKVPAAPHALPVLPGVHLSLQLQPAERRRVRGREQRARLPPAEGASGIVQHVKEPRR